MEGQAADESLVPTLSPSQRILSNDYADFILPPYGDMFSLAEAQPDSVFSRIWSSTYAVYVNRLSIPPLNLSDYSYRTIPKCYGLMDESSLEQCGILTMQNYPNLNLKGQGVALGFVDTGINYDNPAFLSETGESRIYSIWDQTLQTGTPPEGFSYGSEFTREQINAALSSQAPYDLVPTRDETGHGTFLASVAAGSPNEEADFTGAAPLSDLVMVKVKEAKPYLKEYYRIPQDSAAYQENDLMLAVLYLLSKAEAMGKPMVICFSMGSSQGDHTGTSPLSDFLNYCAANRGIAVVVCTGNEADSQHHYQGLVIGQNAYEDVELRVGENSGGFTMELWASYPNQYTISFISPSGETVPRIPARLGQSDLFSFIFEPTRIAVDYELAETRSGAELIQVRFADPSPGVWKIRIYGSDTNLGTYDMWLPIRAFLEQDTYFLRPNPYITLTEPAAADLAITVGAYLASDVSLYLESGRGFTRSGRIKPDFLAPGVNIQGTIYPGRFESLSGTSIAAAIASGAVAQLFTWAFTLGNDRNISASVIKNYFIRGADRKSFLQYPNEEWGYGSLNLYQTFERLRIQ
jgi:subtilisin family serine protease